MNEKGRGGGGEDIPTQAQEEVRPLEELGPPLDVEMSGSALTGISKSLAIMQAMQIQTHPRFSCFGTTDP